MNPNPPRARRARLGPLADRVQVDAARDERGGQLAPPRLERVGAQRDRPARLGRLHQLERLGHAEHGQQRVQHEAVVAVVRRQVALQLRPAGAPVSGAASRRYHDGTAAGGGRLRYARPLPTQYTDSMQRKTPMMAATAFRVE
jgi:hypothetical protein